MTEQTSEARAESAIQRRARVASVMGVVLIATQMGRIGGEHSGRLVEKVQLIASTGWVAVLLLFIAYGGAFFRNRSLRAVLNDESSVEHRQQALAAGFWGFVAMGVLLGIASFYAPLFARDAVQLMITFGVGIALLAFGRLERRALA